MDMTSNEDIRKAVLEASGASIEMVDTKVRSLKKRLKKVKHLPEMPIQSLLLIMAELMPIGQRKIYSVRCGMKERNYKELLSFNSEIVDFLAVQFLEESDTRGGGISRRQQIGIFLRFVGDAGFQSGVAQVVGVHRTTANKTIRYVMSRVVEQSHNWIWFPTRAEDMTEAKVLWQRHFRLPSVIGALDCTQIEIHKPGLHGDFE
ncbi:hypothetical protein WA026_023194 [Henosepilachna vigintioctopunctata]|uniref:Nuclease HARBI1 n=1 Tax=Henosepilachna vigintioctopunctata TaxID=420089 RepID=A0AAW1UQV1_9CUCU